MTDRKSPRSHHADGHSAENAVREGERIQATIDKKDKAKSTKPKAGPCRPAPETILTSFRRST
jgi:hypothetical protein